MTALQHCLATLTHEEAAMLWCAFVRYMEDEDGAASQFAEALLEKLDAAAAQGDVAAMAAAKPMSLGELRRRMREHGATTVTLEHGEAHIAILDGGERFEGATTNEAFAAWCAARERSNDMESKS